MVPMDKDPAIHDLLARLPMREQDWSVVQPDPWEADLCAIAISRWDVPRHLVYVSTCESRAGRYYYECEAPIGTDETDYTVVAEGADVSFAELLGAMIRHLSPLRPAP